MGKLTKDFTIPEEVANFDWEAYENSDRTTLKVNTSIVTEDGDRVFSHEPYAQKMYDAMSNMVFYDKEHKLNSVLQVTDITKIDGTNLTFEFDNYFEYVIDISKEAKFLSLIESDQVHFLQWIEQMSNAERKKYFLETPMYAQVSSVKPTLKISLLKGFYQAQRQVFLDEINEPTAGFVAKITGKNRGGFIAEINGIETFLPGGLAAPNRIQDFDSYIGNEVVVMIEDYLKDSDIFVVSHKKWIKFSMAAKIGELNTSDEYTGYVTGSAKYGVFVEFENFFTGLLHKSKMSPETLNRFNAREFKPGEPVNFFITRIEHKDGNTKIILTDKKPLTELEEWKSLCAANKVISVTVVSSTPQQILVKTKSGILTALDSNDYESFEPGTRTLVNVTNVEGADDDFTITLTPKSNG